MFSQLTKNLAVLGAGALSVFPLYAQDGAAMAAEAEVAATPTPPPAWEANLGFSAVLNTGNNDNQTLGGQGLLGHRFDDNKVTLSGNGAYGRATVNGQSQTNTKNWLANLRYDRFLTETITAFSYGLWSQNVPAGFDDRFGGGAGFGHDFFKTDFDTLRYEAGYDYVREHRVLAADASVHSARTFLKYTRKIGDWASFVQDIEALWNLKEGEDIRLNTLSSLTTKLTKLVSFQVGVGVRFDNQPVAGFRKTDTLTQAGLVVNFI